MLNDNVIPYNFKINQEDRGEITNRKLFQLALIFLGVSSSLYVGISAYNHGKTENAGLAVTALVSFIISDGAQGVWACLQFEDEVRRSLFAMDSQKIATESDCFRFWKNGVAFSVSFVSAFLGNIIYLIGDQKHPGPGNRFLIILFILSTIAIVVYGYQVFFNYCRKLSLPLNHQRVIGHHCAAINNALPHFIDMEKKSRQLYFKGIFYENNSGLFQIDSCLEVLGRAESAPLTSRYLFLKKSIPFLTFAFAMIFDSLILVFSLKDISQGAKEEGRNYKVEEAFYTIANFPWTLIIDCYMFNKLLYNLLDIFYSRQASDYVARKFPVLLKCITALGVALAVLLIFTYRYYPFCKTLQAISVSQAPGTVIQYTATMASAIIEHIFTFIEVSKMLIKCYVEFFGSEENKDKLAFCENMEEMKIAISRMRSDVDISDTPERLNDSEPQNVFERRFNYFFHPDPGVHGAARNPLLEGRLSNEL